jgi:hypothetical protein
MSARPLARFVATLLCALLAAGLPIRAPLALAEEPVRVLVAPLRVIKGGVADALVVRVGEVLADELHGEEALQLAESKQAPATKPEEATGSSGAAAALAQIEKGERLVRALKFKPAAVQIEAGLQDYELFPAQVDIKKLREAYVQLAVAQIRSGDTEAAGRSLQDAVRVAPEVRLTGNYPPVFTQAFASAKRKALAGSRGTVSIKGEGSVELDGKGLGAAPLTAEDLIPGAHFLKVARANGSVWGLKLSVSEGGNAVTIPAGNGASAPIAGSAPELAPLEANTIDASAAAGLARLAKEADAAFVLFGGIYKSGDGVGVATHLYSARTRGLVALKPIHVDNDLVSAGVEGHAVAEEVVQKIRAFPRPGESLPAVVTSELGGAAIARLERPVETPVDVKPPPDKKPVVKKPAEKKPDEDEGKTVVLVPSQESKPDLRIVTRHPDEEPAGGLSAEANHPEAKSQSHAWIWGVVGGIAAVGAGVGGFLLYKNQTQPVTGTATLNFQ